ncbi:MAG: Fic family protein [Deltaproteobacteria bacterium]|jgi:Fic family protein|nr:Fic family protein [Deltaproteobacteria bacterium]
MGIAEQEAQIQQIDALHEQLAAYRPYEGDTLVQLRKYYRLGLTWTSNAIEGSSYTESETKILLEDGVTVAGKTLRETMAALGHAKAYDYMFTLMGKRGIAEQDILAMHGMLDGGMEIGTAGEYRTTAVFVTGTAFKFPSAGEVPALMQILFEQTIPSLASLHPAVQSAKIHKEIVAIHPFSDGNGRVARLAMNTILVQHGYMPVQIYPVIRREYIDSLRHAQTQGDDSDFIELVLQQEIESQKEVLRIIKE